MGPTAGTIRTMGDEAVARASAVAAGVPVVPGSDGTVTNPSAAAWIAEVIGCPYRSGANKQGTNTSIGFVESHVAR